MAYNDKSGQKRKKQRDESPLDSIRSAINRMQAGLRGMQQNTRNSLQGDRKTVDQLQDAMRRNAAPNTPAAPKQSFLDSIRSGLKSMQSGVRGMQENTNRSLQADRKTVDQVKGAVYGKPAPKPAGPYTGPQRANINARGYFTPASEFVGPVNPTVGPAVSDAQRLMRSAGSALKGASASSALKGAAEMINRGAKSMGQVGNIADVDFTVPGSMGSMAAKAADKAVDQMNANTDFNISETRRAVDGIYNSPANVAERERLMKQRQDAQQKLAGVQDKYQKMADKQLYDTSDPKNMARVVAPPENVEIDEGMVAASAQRARDRLAKATQPGGLPNVPDSDPNRPLNAPRGSAYYNPDSAANRRPAKMLDDMTRGEESRQGGVSVFNPVTRARRKFADGSKQNVVAGNTVDYSPETGRMTIGPKGSKRMVILPASGNSIGLRTIALDDKGNPIPGTITTQSDEARRKARQDLAIIKGNEPGATAEEKLAGKQAKEAQDKYAAYKARQDKREADALDLRAAAEAMRGYGPVGMQNVGFSSMGRNINPEFAMKYGQTGPSLAQAAGMVRQQRAAEERMDEAMKRQQKQAQFDRDMKEREFSLKEDEVKREVEDLKKKDSMVSGTEEIEAKAMENEAVKQLVNAPATPEGLKSVLQRDDLTDEQKKAWMASELQIGSDRDLRRYLYNNGLEADGYLADEFTNYLNPLNYFNFYQTPANDALRDSILASSPFSQ